MGRMDRWGGEAEPDLVTMSVLTEALDVLPEGVAVYDAAGCLMFWNHHYEHTHAGSSNPLKAGQTFESLLRGFARSGQVPDAIGREDEWIAERLQHQALPASVVEYRLADGRWIRAEDKHTPSGLRVGIRIDITDLKRREASFRMLFESNPVPILVKDRDSHAILAVNDAMLELFGYTREALLARTTGDLCAEGLSAPIVDAMPWRCVRSDGTYIDLLPSSSDFTRNGRPAVIMALVDMTEVEKGREDLSRTRAFLDSVVETIPSIVFAKDMQDGGRYVLLNRAGELQGRRTRAEVIGRTDLDLFPSVLASTLRDLDAEVVRDGQARTYEVSAPGPDGVERLIHVQKVPIVARPGEPPRFVLGVADDITERREMERLLDQAARYDDITGLPNRIHLSDLLRKALDARCSGADTVAMLLVDLDEFRMLNDALGHGVGDALLCAVGSRLAGEMGSSETVGRFAADEFVVLQRNIGSVDEAEALACRLLDCLRRPFAVGGQNLLVGASIGIALAEPDTGADALLRHAELALQRAKAVHRGAFQVFETVMEEDVRRRRALQQDLRGALERGEFELHYQPQIDLATEAVTGFEALLRWRHPVRGLVDPNRFIPVAEETGLIVPLGAWVLARACADAASWPVPVRVAVNLSPVQFLTPGLPEAVESALAGSGLPPARLELEITESVRLIDNEQNLGLLRGFRAAGIKVALDDFGTGFASLSYLRSFPFDKIKIDRSFVSDLGQDEGCLAIVRAATRLARDLGMETIAEGIETTVQFLQLRQLGCTEGQGYLFGRPMPGGEVSALLLARQRRGAEPAATPALDVPRMRLQAPGVAAVAGRSAR